jgi:protein gp37
MGNTTKIAWTDSTWNPHRGCHKVSAGCLHCYWYRDAARYGYNPGEVVRSKTTFRDPLKWKEPRKIFVCSWSDFFIEEADAWRGEVWDIIRKTPHHTYQICTKRVENIPARLPSDWGNGYSNVWLGATTENGTEYARRVSGLMSIPAKIHWLSIEPMLSRVEGYDSPDWVVIGGESGPNARAFNPDWARSSILWWRSRGAKVFVKQLGSNPCGLELLDRHGADPSEWDADLNVREFPVPC